MYGILCAVPEELAALRARLTLNPEPEVHGPMEVWRGEHDGAQIALVRSGIGKVNAAAAATLLATLYAPRALIFSGVAGGLDPDLPVGAVLLADRLAIHDYGLVQGGRFTPTAYGIIPVGAPRLAGLPPVAAETAAVLSELAAKVAPELGHPVRDGLLVAGALVPGAGVLDGGELQHHQPVGRSAFQRLHRAVDGERLQLGIARMLAVEPLVLVVFRLVAERPFPQDDHVSRHPNPSPRAAS
jgi:5'-methylthioadenosine/S-adenosylhomocysteine nucleosidase